MKFKINLEFEIVPTEEEEKIFKSLTDEQTKETIIRFRSFIIGELGLIEEDVKKVEVTIV